MQLDLDGKIALVTGSSDGIGWAIAQQLYIEGCQIALNGRNKANLENAVAKLPGAIGIGGDFTSSKEAQRVVEETVKGFGKIDVLICNVGSGRSVPPGEETAEEWQRIFALNLWSATNAVEAAKHELIKTGGAIVCISSICGLEVIAGAPVTYSAAKAALHAFVRGISRPLGKDGIRINAVAPGNILFKNSVWARKMKDDKKSVKAMLEKEVALSKLGSVSDVAKLAVYLAAPISGFATGGVWTLDGGQVRS